MNRRLFFVFLFATFGMVSVGQYVTLEGRQFKDENGEDFYPVVCNYLVTYLYKNNDTSTLFISPDLSCDAWCYDHNTLADCLDQMEKNFDTIKGMGFNAIRLFGANPNYCNFPGEPKGWRIKAMNYDSAIQTSCNKSSLNDSLYYYFCAPFNTNATAQLLFSFFDSVMLRAYDAGLKVILVAGGGAGHYSLDYPAQYALYLDALSAHIADSSPSAVRETLMAYDLDNEPSWSWTDATMWPNDTIGHSKQDVCDNVKLFSGTIKENDPNHLTTLGGRSIIEVFEYDPAILAIDFYSPHFYPVTTPYDYAPLSNKLDRVHGHFVWLESVLPMPYLIGETGFRANPYGVGPDGDLYDQKDYAIYTLDLTRFYKGSGYSWWNYQDYYWSAHDCFFGLLYRDNTPAKQVTEKPVVEAFESYDPNDPPSSFSTPSNYYDPFNHEYFNPDNNHLSGHVQDQDGKPIQDALVLGWTAIKLNAQGITEYESHYTFSDSVGDFTIIPYDYYDTLYPNYEVIVQVRISAPGCSRFISGWYNNSTGVPQDSVETVILQKTAFVYSDTIRDSVCTVNSCFQAWNDLVFNDVSVSSSVNFEAKARREILLFQEFYAASGSEAAIFLEETYLPCDSLSSGFLKMGNLFSSRQENPDQNASSLQLNFEPYLTSFNFNIYPNPCTDFVYIEIPDFKSSDKQTLYFNDAYGKTLITRVIKEFRTQINLEEIPSGIYQITIRNQNKIKTKKIILF